MKRKAFFICYEPGGTGKSGLGGHPWASGLPQVSRKGEKDGKEMWRYRFAPWDLEVLLSVLLPILRTWRCAQTRISPET